MALFFKSPSLHFCPLELCWTGWTLMNLQIPVKFYATITRLTFGVHIQCLDICWMSFSPITNLVQTFRFCFCFLLVKCLYEGKTSNCQNKKKIDHQTRNGFVCFFKSSLCCRLNGQGYRRRCWHVKTSKRMAYLFHIGIAPKPGNLGLDRG